MASVSVELKPEVASASLSRTQIAAILALLFAISIAIRHPLFNKELTSNWESLSGHVLLTCKAWSQTSPAIHHFNLLFNFSRPEDKFINDLGTAGVGDRFGNYYYTSMPHLAYILPYLSFVVTGQAPNILGLQIFSLLVHFIACALLYLLVRRMTKAFRASQLASLAAVCVLLFTPQALFYFQNAVVGNTLIVPFTLGLLLSLTALASDRHETDTRSLAWVGLAVCLILGCLTDWHAYFNALSATVVFLFLAKKGVVTRSTSLKVATLCAICVMLALSIFCWQNSRIAGLDSFFHAIFGRLRARVGDSPSGLGLNSIEYYQNLARYYIAYSPFLLVIAGLIALSIRRQGTQVLRTPSVRRAAIPFFISALGVALDHLALANHTGAHSFKSVDDLVPLGMLMGLSVAMFLETRAETARPSAILCALLVGCIAAESAVYYSIYSNRPHPFRAAASRILSAAPPSDVLFTTWHDELKKPFIFYLGRNIQTVSNQAEAAEYLSCRQFPHGTLVAIDDSWTVTQISPVLPSPSGCPAHLR